MSSKRAKTINVHFFQVATDEQDEEWNTIVGTMDPGHLMRGNYPLLSQLCRHIVSSRRIAQLIEQVANEKVLDRNELSALFKLQAAESAAMMASLTCSLPRPIRPASARPRNGRKSINFCAKRQPCLKPAERRMASIISEP